MQTSSSLLAAIVGASLLVGGCSTTNEAKKAEENWDAEKLYQESHLALQRGDAAGAVRHLETLQVRFPLADYAKQAQLDIIVAYYQREEYDYAITSADQFIQLNPQSPHAAYAWYMKGRCELARTRGLLDKYFPRDMSTTDQRLINTARSYFDQVSTRYPDSPWAEASRQESARLLEELAQHELFVAQFYFERGAYVGAINRIKTLLSSYPDTQYRAEALELLIDCYDKQGLSKQAEVIRAQLSS